MNTPEQIEASYIAQRITVVGEKIELQNANCDELKKAFEWSVINLSKLQDEQAELINKLKEITQRK